MSAPLVADGLLSDAIFELQPFIRENPVTGEYEQPAGDLYQATIEAIEGARRLLERARREQARVPARLVPAVSDPRQKMC